jgi:DNA replication protein DnaC
MDKIPSSLLPVLGELIEGRSPWPLYLYGGVGAGKTCAGLLLCDHVTDAMYETCEGFEGMMREAATGRAEWYREGVGGLVSEGQLWGLYRRYPLVVLDEIGLREKASDFQYRVLKRLIEERTGMPLVLISNLSLDGLRQIYDERMVSRITCGTVVRLDGPDQRDPRGARS